MIGAGLLVVLKLVYMFSHVIPAQNKKIEDGQKQKQK
jgi:hypothetical protein